MRPPAGTEQDCGADERALFAACQGHFLSQHPLPDVGPAMALADPRERLRAVLRAFYSWYRETEAMSGNVQRDRATMPVLDSLMAESSDAAITPMVEMLAGGFGGASTRRRAATALAFDFWTWRRLAREGLSDAQAADLMASAVASA